MSLNTEHLSLPPLVKGSLKGHLTIKVDDLIWCRQPPGDVYVVCRWWGMSSPVVFKPSDVTQRDKKSQLSSSLLIKDYTVTFDIRTGLTMLENYMKNCENLEFIVIKSKCHEKIGTVTVPELSNLVKERMYQRYFPIINSFGNRIGDLHIGFSLWMKSKFEEEKENKSSANDLSDKPIIGKEKRNKEKTLKVCKKHSRMLKNSQNKMVTQSVSRCYSMGQSNKEKLPHTIESFNHKMKGTIHPFTPPNSVKSDIDLESILSRGEKLRNAMFSSLYEDEVFRKTISSERTNVAGSHESFPSHPSSSATAHENSKAILMSYLTGADITSTEKQVALETLKSVSPAESILFDSLSVEAVEPHLEKVEEKVQEQGAEEKNDDDNNQATSSRVLECTDKQVIDSAPSSCEELQSQSQNPSNENINDKSEELRLLQAAFTSVNCCRITVDYLKLVSSNVSKNEFKDLRVRNHGINKNKCQQPGAVYFVEYNFNYIKQPLNQQYHTPVRYSTKKQSGPVIHFGQNHIHNLRKPFSVERLKASLQNANWKILRRYLNQRVPSLIGSVFIDNDFDVRLESTLSFPVKSNTGIHVGELFIQLELGKDRGIFGNFLLGEKILAFPGKTMIRSCVEIQTETEELAEPSVSRDSLNNWTSSTTGNSRIHVGDHIPMQKVALNTGKCHQVIIELDELTNYSTLLKTGKDEACYIDYKFPEFDEKTNKIHFSNKFFTTDCMICSSEIRFFFRHSHMLNASSLSQAFLTAAIPGITFSLWTRKFHPGIHDHLVATAFLPTAKLCSLENSFNSRNSVLEESLTLPLTATSAILHKGELHSKNRCSLHLTLTYRQIVSSASNAQKSNSIISSTVPVVSNTEVTGSNSTIKSTTDMERNGERDGCSSFEKSGDLLQIPSSEKIISQLKQFESHKCCVKDNCVCRNYHSLFGGEKTHSSKYPAIDNKFTSSMKNNDEIEKRDIEKRLAINTVNNPAIRSILNSQLSEECQEKFVNFILQGNTKLNVASRCDGSLNGVSNSHGYQTVNSGLKSKLKFILSHTSMENINKNCTTVQHVHILQSGKVNRLDEMNQKSSTEEDLNETEIISHVNNLLPEQNHDMESVKESRKDGEFLSAQSLDMISDPGEMNTNAEFQESEEDCNKNENNHSLDLFKVISPPAGFENPSCSSLRIQEHRSETPERLQSFSAQSPFECNENRLTSSASGSNTSQHHSFFSQEKVLKGNKYFFKPLYCEKRILSSASDIFDHDEKRPASSNNDCQVDFSQKQRKNSISESDDNRNVPRLSRAVHELQNPQSEVESQLSNYIFESKADSRPESLYELRMQSGGEDGEDLLSVVTQSVENIQLDSSRSKDNQQEHDIDDLLTESQQEKVPDNHSLESTWVDSIKVSSELRNIIEHLNPRNKNDDKVYDKLLCELKAYVDNVAKEIKNQLDFIEVNLQENHQNAKNSRSDLLTTEIEDHKDKEDISSANAYSVDSQNYGYVCNAEYASSATNNSESSKSSRMKQNECSTDLTPIASPRNSIACEDISKKMLSTKELSASWDAFSRSTSSAFTKYKSTKQHKKQKLFKAKVEVERGYHLPKVTHPFSQSGFADNPNTFVKLQTSCHSLDEGLFSNVVENSCDPVWMACFDVDLPTELLKQGLSNRLVVQVFEKRERVTQLLGTATIGLSILSSGLPLISGWFNLFDVSGICKGQIRVNITPIDNIAKFQCDSKDSSENEVCDLQNKDHNIGKSCQKRPRNSIFSSREMSKVDGDYVPAGKIQEKNEIETQCPSVQLTSSLKSKLSELDLLIDALKMKLRTSERSSSNAETAHGLQPSSIEELEVEYSLENIDKMQFCGIPKTVTGSSCSNEDINLDDARRTVSEQPSYGDVIRKCSDQNESPSDYRQEDGSPFRTYSIHSYDDDSTNKTDISISDQE